MQMALEQYLIGEDGSTDPVTFHEALQTQHDPYLQRFVLYSSLCILHLFDLIFIPSSRAIEESLLEYSSLHAIDEEPRSNDSSSSDQHTLEQDMELAISLSRQELAQYQQQRREEDDVLERVLKLSMTEK